MPEETIYAFIAGGIAGAVLLFFLLVLLGESGTDPDNW